MKKPIDPNLFSGDSEDILLPVNEEEDAVFTINEKDKPKPVDPNFIVTETVIAKTPDKSVAPAVSSGEEHHHHHSSSGEHHSSSGEHHHHSSGSSHHHSSGSSHHHSSSGSHRHHSGSSHHRHSSGSAQATSKKKKKKLPLAARIAIAVILLLLFLVSVVIGTFMVLRSMGKKELTTVQDAQYEEVIEYNGHHYQYNENMATVGFIGVDKYQFLDAEDTNFVGSADADIVVAVDTKTGKTSVIAVPRDTITDINITTSSGKVFVRTAPAQLCLAYAYGDGREESCKNTAEAMSRILLNIPVEKYYALDMDGIAPLNDAIGGVTLTAQYDIPEDGIVNGEEVTLMGDMAEHYVRRRDMDKADAAVSRSDRQIQYVKAYASQLLPAVIKDFSTVSTLYNTASAYSQTNISLSNVTYMASLLLSKGVTDFDAYRLQGEAVAVPDSLIPGVAHAEFYPDDDDVMQTVLNVFYTQID